MMMTRVFFILLIFGLTSLGCTSTTIRPFRDGASVTAATEGEERLWASADKLDKSLRKSGQIYQDDTLKNYMQEIMDRLYPEFKGKIKVRLLKDPVLNAFALPNGSIYINIGLIAALDNEAQIATVLAHEGIHFTMKHSALQREHFYNATGAGMAVSLLGVPFIGQLAAASSIFGYSQEHELEADKLGYERLVNAGYDTLEAPKAFKHLLLESGADGAESPFFFSTHPALEKRIENFDAFNKTKIPGPREKGIEVYRSRVAELRDYVLEEKVRAGRYDAIIKAFAIEELQKSETPQCRFYLGEAYRLRGKEGDMSNALKIYTELLNLDPQFTQAYKSMGIISYKDKNFTEAKSYFEKYLSSGPDEKEAVFVRHYLKIIENKGTPNED